MAPGMRVRRAEASPFHSRCRTLAASNATRIGASSATLFAVLPLQSSVSLLARLSPWCASLFMMRDLRVR